MDIAPLIVWAAGLTTLLNLANMLWTLFSGPARKLGQRLGETEEKVAQAERDIHRLRDRLDHMPNTAALHQLELSIARMEGEISRLIERIGPVAAITERMQELMLEQGRK